MSFAGDIFVHRDKKFSNAIDLGKLLVTDELSEFVDTGGRDDEFLSARCCFDFLCRRRGSKNRMDAPMNICQILCMYQ